MFVVFTFLMGAFNRDCTRHRHQSTISCNGKTAIRPQAILRFTQTTLFCRGGRGGGALVNCGDDDEEDPAFFAKVEIFPRKVF